MTDFKASMPAAYARAFAAAQIAEHAQIAGRRGDALAHAELCRAAKGSLVCVVADDRPGLLALVTDALLVQGFGIHGAQAYCRKRVDGTTERVDFLELHQSVRGGATESFEASELAAFLQTLIELISEDIQASARPSAAPVRSVPPARVYFELEALRREEYVLLVEARDSQGLLHAITSALYAQGVRILTCQIATDAGQARDRFELASVDGKPLTAVDLCDIQLSVLSSLPR
jgi:UTP:GlnB (protein PII) uridylyltransferase